MSLFRVGQSKSVAWVNNSSASTAWRPACFGATSLRHAKQSRYG